MSVVRASHATKESVRSAGEFPSVDGELPVGGAFSGTDLRRLADTIRDARRASGAPVSSLLEPALPEGGATSLTERNCRFDHCAVLLFPQTLDAGLRHLEQCGLAPLPTVPSTVVRRRLSARHGLDPESCDVHLTRLRLDLPDGRRHPAVEVFLFPRDCAAFDPHLAASEAAHGFEDHTAFVVGRPSPPLLADLVTAWRTEAGLLWEGGGHNPHEGPQGSTVLYFVRAHGQPARRRRFELHCPGDLRAFLDRIPLEAEAVRHAYREWRRAAPDVPA
ncbi:hypothetical protein GCM10012285_58700 [Streptomyces kronopolitis]|uniref:Uncharacterized protein n=1 Tax=Streptomyces kronopolitis TaxID=1612435 RepID=A0ABQ2K0V8_9ACTN|nr:hypothetical protein GCM10012285_58700 [Streptomyces kronopolitis]